MNNMTPMSQVLQCHKLLFGMNAQSWKQKITRCHGGKVEAGKLSDLGVQLQEEG